MEFQKYHYLTFFKKIVLFLYERELEYLNIKKS